VVHLSTDQELVTAIGRGDAAALATLFARYRPVVHRFLGRLGGGDDRERDDLLQATFIEVQRSAARFAGRSSVRTWILGVAANVMRHHVRSSVRRRQLHQAAAEAGPATPSSVAPDQLFERRELLARLSAAVAQLPSGLREPFVMCELEEVPGPEVARVLDLREGTLWRRLHEARRRLRTALAGCC
jgi:RNA polymerase sigma-70 factor (ECF subfamily)